VALSSEVVNLGKAGPDGWWADHRLATVRPSARSEGARAVFIGIAPSADVARYLGSASYDEISDLLSDPFEYSLTRRGAREDCQDHHRRGLALAPHAPPAQGARSHPHRAAVGHNRGGQTQHTGRVAAISYCLL
jgi:hypothetical protein